MRTALIAGATGLVGGYCLRALRECPEYGKLIVLGRKRIELENYITPQGDRSMPVEQRTIDFERLSPEVVTGAEDIFCALGTTIDKAGSPAAFRRVDFDYVFALAKAAAAAGAKRFVLVSSVGADGRSRNLYLRTKGETEQAVAALPFQAVHILRPSLLLGTRNERRRGEDLAQRWMPRLAFLMPGPLRKYRAIAAETVAHAMVYLAGLPVSGVHIYEYDQIMQALASNR